MSALSKGLFGDLLVGLVEDGSPSLPAIEILNSFVSKNVSPATSGYYATLMVDATDMERENESSAGVRGTLCFVILPGTPARGLYIGEGAGTGVK